MPATDKTPGFDAVSALRGVGLRPTRQRVALVRLIAEGGDRHLSAEELHGEAHEAGIRVSVATVYNTLHRFVRAGLLREIAVAPGCVRFDTNTRHHHHFYDENNGELIDVSGEAVSFAELPAAPDGRRIARVDVIVRLSRTGQS